MEIRSVTIATLGVVFSAFLLSGGISHIKSVDVVSVTGSAQKLITSDVGVWKVSLTRSVGVGELKAGYSQIDGDLKALRGYLTKNKVDAKAVTISPVRVESLVNYNNAESVTGFRLSQEVIVELSDVFAIQKLAEQSSELLSGGIVISTTSLEFYYSKLPKLRIEMLSQATKDAKARAENIAQSAGASLGALTDASTGVFQLSPVHSTDVSDYGNYDTSSIEKQITAIVRTSFRIH